MADNELSRIQSILDKYKDLNFVQRILTPDKYPSISNKDGTHSTHLMAWGEHEGKHIVFPTIIQYPSGRLSDLGIDRAFEHAVQTNSYIPFDSPEDADWFSQNYKKVWEQ